MKRTQPPAGYLMAAREMQARHLAAAMHTMSMNGKCPVPSIPVSGINPAVLAEAHQRLQAALPGKRHTQH